jgi:hypothetical protein
MKVKKEMKKRKSPNQDKKEIPGNKQSETVVLFPQH